MRCLDCGAEMQLIEVPDEGMASTGYERHAFECPNCRNRPDRLLKPVANERIRLPPPAPLIAPALASRLAPATALQIFRRHSGLRQFRRIASILVPLIAIASITAMIPSRHGPQGLRGPQGPPGPGGARGSRSPWGGIRPSVPSRQVRRDELHGKMQGRRDAFDRLLRGEAQRRDHTDRAIGDLPKPGAGQQPNSCGMRENAS